MTKLTKSVSYLSEDETNAMIENLKTFDLTSHKILILYRYSSTVVNLITLDLAEGNELCLHTNSSYLGWITGGSSGVTSYALYQNFTSTSYGASVSLSVNSNGYFPSSYARILSGDASNVLYCNVDIYNRDKDTLFRKADTPIKIGENDVFITNITHEPVYVGDTSVVFDVETMVGENASMSIVKYEWVNETPPFETMGSYEVKITATTQTGGLDTRLYRVTAYPDRNIPYPTDFELPPQDGQMDIVVARNGLLKYCITSDSISSVDGFYHAGNRLVAKTDGVSVNSTLYRYSDLNQCWTEIAPSTGQYYNRFDCYHAVPLEATIEYSTVDIYDSSAFETIIHPKNVSTSRQKYDYTTMQLAPVIECTNPMLFDSNIEGYITMRLTKTATTVYCFGFRRMNGTGMINVSFEPTTLLSVMDNIEMCILSWNTSKQVWSYARKWGAVEVYGLSSSYGNLYYLIQEIHNLNIYIHSKNRERGKLLYESEKVREPIPLYFYLNGEFVQGASDSSSSVKVFDGEYWHGIELTTDETGIKIFINDEWKNIGIY